MKPSLARNFLLIFAATFVVLLAANWAYYFATPFHEQGDAALNALQIDQAKSFHELYGNYSRFRFHHPGPVFFYLYAWSELILCDGLKLDLSPYNAHSLAGLAVQAAFFALALSLAAQWVNARLFLPLALLAASIHFAIAGNAFSSIWPPHVLLMPFLAFWLACLSLACGRGKHLVWVVLAGSVLVHGHVAQPLFVIVLSGVSYGLFFTRLHRSKATPANPVRLFPRPHLIAGIVLLVFCTPLLLDLFRGDESNFAEILRHVRDNTEQMKKPVKSLLYLVSFFGYVHNQDDVLRELSPASLSFFRENWPAFATWIILLLASGLALCSLRHSSEKKRDFWRTGLVLWLVTMTLGLIWGILQTGRMYEFNSHFFYSITYLALLPSAAWLAGKLELHRFVRAFAWTIVVAAIVIAAWGFSKPRLSPGESGLVYLDTVQKNVAADPHPERPKLLAFDPEEWPQAATVALALERLDKNYYVDQPWWFMFSHRRTIPAAILCEPQPEVSVWHLLPANDPTGRQLVGENVFITSEVPALDAAKGLVDFAQHENYLQFLTAGFSNLQGSYAWMCQENAVLQFHPGVTTQDVELDFAVVPYLPPDGKALPLEVFFNGQQILHTAITRPGHLVCKVPKELWSLFPVASLRLFSPGAHNPSEPGLSRDRSFGSLSVRRLITRPSSS